MTSTSNLTPINIKLTTHYHRCVDGCCDEYTETASVSMSGEETFELDVTYSHLGMYEKILAKLGYTIVMEEDDV